MSERLLQARNYTLLIYVYRVFLFIRSYIASLTFPSFRRIREK